MNSYRFHRAAGWHVLVVLAVVLAVATGGDRAAAGLPPQFSVHLGGQTQIGGAKVTLDLSGSLAVAAGVSACAGGDVTSGTLVVSDSDESHTAVITEGVGSVRCVPGFEDGLFVDLRGYWVDQVLTPVSIRAIGTMGTAGNVADVVGDISSQGGYYRDPAGSTQLTARFRGAGASEGLAGSGPAGGTPSMLERYAALETPATPDPLSGAVTAAAAPKGPKFTASFVGAFELGRARISVDVVGFGRRNRANCGYAQLTRGTIELRDGDETFRGTISGGDADDCGQGGPKGQTPDAKPFNLSAFGSTNGDEPSRFSLTLQGMVGAGGRFTAAEAVFFAFPDNYGEAKFADPRRIVEQLQEQYLVYTGGFSASGHEDGLTPLNPTKPPKVQKLFRMAVRGRDGGTAISVTLSGKFYSSGGAGAVASLQPDAGTLTVGDEKYEFKPGGIGFIPDGKGGGRIQLFGAVVEPATGGDEAPVVVGILIGTLDVSGVGAAFWDDGGEATIIGEISTLRVRDVAYEPSVTGKLTAKVIGR